MPNRILKERICSSDSIDNLTWFEEVLFYRLIVNCDDYGRFDGRPAIIKNRLFPLKENLTMSSVSKAINTLASAGLVVLYTFEGKPFLYLPTWNEHQTVRAKRSKYPAPDSGVIASENICKQMQANVPVIQSNSESNSESNAGNARKRFTPPTLEEVTAYVSKRGYTWEPSAFFDFYSAKGWKVGTQSMKDWRAAVRNWERMEGKYTPRKDKRDYGANNAPRDDSAAMSQLDRLMEKMGDG